MINQMSLNFYSLLILLFLRYLTSRYSNPTSKTQAIFKQILLINIGMLVFDSFTWLIDGYPGQTGRLLVYFSNGLLYLFSLLPICLWLTYLDSCIIISKAKRTQRLKIYVLINLLVAALIAGNPLTQWFYYVDAGNYYIRQTGIYLLILLNCILFLAYLLSLRSYSKFIRGRHYQVILLLGFLPIVGAILQAGSYGTTLIWPLMALVALATYILVEREEIKKDALTGLSTRSQLEERMLYMIEKQQPFTVIMIDLDKFKAINDCHGHEEGDTALKTVAIMLEKSIKQADLACRYAGDEFVLLLESKNEKDKEIVEERLRRKLERINNSQQKPYKLSLSMGAAHYDGTTEVSIYSLLALADKEMYLKKAEKAEKPIIHTTMTQRGLNSHTCSKQNRTTP